MNAAVRVLPQIGLTMLLFLSGCAAFVSERPPGAAADANYVAAAGVDLHYREWGQANRDRGTVVFIHGFAASLESWGPIPEYIGEQFHVIAFDVKGFGLSPRPAGDYAPPAQAVHLWAGLDQLGVKRATLVGHSWGASLVLAMALAQPERVERLALMSAYAYDEEVPTFFRWAQSPLGDAMFAMFYRQQLAERVRLAYYDERYVTAERVANVEREMSRPGTTAAALAAVRGQRYADLSRRYPTITAPTLIVWGQEDRVTPVAFADRLARDLSNSRVKIYPLCGHMPMVEADRKSVV